MSPTVLLGLLLALIGAQITWLATPRRLGFPLVLGLAVAGMVVAEVAAPRLGAGGPALGAVHPLADIIGIALAEAIGTLVGWPRAPRRAA
jgi:hypothetical protein